MDICLDSLAHNYEATKEHVSPAQLYAVVKSEAYGHGAVPVARHLADMGCESFAVAMVDEGVQLRRAGIEGDILVMGATLSRQFATMAEHRLTPVLPDVERLTDWAELAAARGERLSYHIKVDVGLGRMGLMPADGEIAARSARELCPHIEPVGVSSHLSHPSGDEEHNEVEYRRFLDFCQPLVEAFPGLRRHLAASQAAARFEHMHFEMVRIGGLLYGLNHIDPSPVDLHPVMTLTTAVAQVRTLPRGWWIGYNQTLQLTEPTRVAVLPMGWTDGLTTYHVGSASLLVRGEPCPLLGVCTDFAMLDVSDAPDVRVGDEVVLVGGQGEASISAIELGRAAGISTGQLLGKLSVRVPRLYHSGGRCTEELSIVNYR